MFRRPDRLFRRYQQTGEPRLLGLVFDRTAPELMRVALHLTRDRHRAEDALQSTFLTAIEKAQSYDAARPLLPWLLSILANHARQAHRRERRPLPAVAPRSHEHVADAAAGRELAEVCDRAIEALAEPYRHVLLLHLRHGLSGQEIAVSLDRLDSTVRNQIARGLDLLRRKLPAGVASAAVISAASARGLAAVRMVLAKVPVPVGGATVLALGPSPWLFGVLLMSKKVLVPLVLLPLLAGGLWYSGAFADAASGPVPVDAPPTVAAASVERAAASDEPSREAPLLRDEPGRDEPGRAAAQPTVGSLHATVVVRDLDTPVADAAFAVWTHVEGEDRRIAAEGVTRADGTATVEGLVPGGYELHIDPFGDQESFAIEAGVVQRVRCEVHPGVRLAGSVVDRDGLPVGGAEVRGAADWCSVLLAHTAPDGTFCAEHVRGGLLIWAAGAGRQPSKRHQLDYRSSSQQVRLVIGGAGARVFARVLDEKGHPEANARLYVALDTQAGSSFLQLERHDGRTNEAGEFAADWVTPGHVLVAAVRRDGDLDRASMQQIVVEEGVPARVLLRLGDGASVVGSVRNERGEPVAGARVWESYGHSGLDPLGRRATTTTADGAFALRGLLPGTHWLGAQRGGTRLDERIELARGQRLEWAPVLAEGAPIALRVIGPDDEPLAHLRVNVLQADRNPKLYGSTDEAGRCRFENLPLVEHTFQVLAGDLSVVVVEQTVMPSPTEVTIRLDATRMPSSRLTGRIVDARGKPVANCELSLHANSNFVQPQRIDQDGRFTTDLLPPGSYSLSARAKAAGLGHAFFSGTLDARQTRDVGDLVLPETASLTMRLRAADGGKVQGAVLRLGHPGDVHPGAEDLAPDEVDGAYRQTGIDPGAYVLRLLGPDVAPQNVSINLAAGERRELDLSVQRAVPNCIEIRCRLDSQDHGLANGRLSVTNAAGERVVFHSLWGYFDDNAQRLVRLRFGLAPGVYQVHAEEFGGKQKDLQIEVPTAAPPGPFVVDLR